MLSLSHPRNSFRLAAALCLALATAAPTVAQLARQEKAQMEVGGDRTAYLPGEEIALVVSMEIEHDWHTNSNQPTYDYLIPTEVEVAAPEAWAEARVAYPAGEMKSFAFADEEISVYEGEVVMVASLTVPAEAKHGDTEVEVRLTYQACNDRSCLPPVTTEQTVRLVVGPGGTSTGLAAPTSAATGSTDAGAGPPPPGEARGGRSLAVILLLGLLGGLILNAMPCVLPVLSLKVFGLVKSAGQGRRHVVRGVLATAAGILFSFWALAVAAILAKAAGAAVGWGVQFQQPAFVAGLTIVVVLFCLNLWGLFEVPLPARIASVGASPEGDHLAGHFSSGLFATLMATPCSAPFLGTAVGFALAQDASTILAIFTSIGLGMALPYLLLAIAPGTASLLPKPGPWMVNLRILMGFLLAGAAVWLLYVLAAQISSERVAFFQIALLVLAMVIWWSHSVAANRGQRRLAGLAIAATIVVAIGLVYGADLATPSVIAAEDRRIEWKPFDRAQAEQLEQEGQLVFVDVTADWCFTCKVNERLALETDEVADAFERHGVIAMKADWTNRDDGIATYLADHGRYGIPFYLLYRPGRAPHLFGELITKQEVVQAVQEAVGDDGTTRLSSF